MLKDVFSSIGAAARKLFTNFGAVLIAFLCYAALWMAGYLFVAVIGQATRLQVILSLVILPLAAVIFFFLLQAIGLSYVRIGVGSSYLLKRALKDFWKLLIVSLPLIALAYGLWWLFGYLDKKFVTDVEKPKRWMELSLLAGRWLLLYLALPLVAIHNWMAAIREGLGGAFRSYGHSIAAAFSPRSVLIYVIVLLVCGAVAWLAAFTETHVKSDWGELWLAGGRFAFALLMIFIGWLLMLGAMAEMTTRRALHESLRELNV
ncbi:MAG: hypothetical protein JST85_23310 [Acidobacteria bacterium]|nr:hypothetical protein [Acidobacteriota bacterium]